MMIEIKNVTKNFIKTINKKEKITFTAVNNISFNANDGKIVGILGPNGAGKTTLLRMIAGIMEPNEGEILIDNENYKTKVTGQGITTGGKLEVMPNFIGSSVSEVEAWASERGIVLHKEFVDSNSKYYNPNVNAGLVANQSVSMKVLVLNVKELTIYINEASNNNLGGNTPNTDNPNDNKNEDNQDNNQNTDNPLDIILPSDDEQNKED